MRMLMKATIPVDKGNAAVRDGSMEGGLRAMIEQLKPEAAYFGVLDGQWTAFIVFDMQSQAEMVPVLEQVWMSLEADIDLIPVMNAEDLMQGLGSTSFAAMGDAASQEAGNQVEVME